MAGDRARVSYDATRKWRGAVAQQGRVTVEADINEAATIEAERDRLTTLDVVGPVGTPDGGYAVTAFGASPSSATTFGGGPPPNTPGDLQVGPGTLYLGGVRLDLDTEVTYSTQPDWLDHSTDPLWADPAIPSGNSPPSELITLRAIEVEVSATEDPALADVALGGPDTMQRRRILQHIVRQPVSASDCAGAQKEFIGSLNGLGLSFDDKSMLLGSTTSLQVSFSNTVSQPSPCEPTATGGYLGAENQLIRVMITSVDAKTGVPTIVWGFDNASFLYRLSAATSDSNSNTTTVTLASSPVDSFHFPALGQAVELLRDAAALTATDYIASPTGFISALTAAYDPTQMQLVFAGQPPDDYFSATPQLYLRVWQGTAAAPVGQAITLGDTGLAVTVSSSGNSFNIGDFWIFAVRPIDPAIVYPQRYLDAPQPPEGPRTWLCPLAVLTWAGGEAKVAGCVPPFENLVALTGANSCGCTVTVGPADVADGADLAALVASYAGRGPVSVCLEPGTYTLSEPIVLGTGLDGLTLKACAPGVILAAPQSPGPQFSLGLIVVQGIASITIDGIELHMPLTGFTPASGAFSALGANQQLMDAFAAGLQLGFGISATDSTFLLIKDCSFYYPEPAATNVFGAGIYATGMMPNLKLTGCSFFGPLSQPDATPFNDLAAGNQVQPPYQLNFGYLHVPTVPITEVGSISANVLLRDALIERCVFQGTTVPVLAMARLGSVRVSQNAVRDCYGGFWLVSVAGDTSIALFDEIAIGNSDTYRQTATAGFAAVLDRIFVMASAMGRVLPTTPPASNARPIRRVIVQSSDENRALARSTFAAIYRAAVAARRPSAAPAPSARVQSSAQADSPAQAKSAAPPAEAAPATGPDDLPAAFDFIFEPQQFVPRLLIPTAETGYGLIMRIDVSDCQVDAVVASSYSGAGLLVIDFSQTQGSVIVDGCRMRTRFPWGETAFFLWPVEATITGNIIANEIGLPIEPSTQDPDSYSITMFPLSPFGDPAIAITGNVFIDPTILPPRPSSIPAPLNQWNILNTVIAYVAPPIVSGLSPTSGSATGGDSVTITGSGFASATGVSFGTAPAAIVDVGSDSQMTVTSPAGSGTVDVTVASSAGTSTTNPADQFTYFLRPRPGPRPFGAAPASADKPSTASEPDQPTTDEPATDQPTTDQPTTDQPATDPAQSDKPTSKNPISDKRISEKPASAGSLPESKTPQTSRIASTGVTRPMKRPDQPSPPPADS